MKRLLLPPLLFLAACSGTVGTMNGSGSGSGGGTGVTHTSPLYVDAVVVPDHLSRGQTFPVTVRVHNQGGSTASAVTPTLAVTASGGAAATVNSAPGPKDVAPGASVDFAYMMVENGSAKGELALEGQLPGDKASASAVVENPALVHIASVSLPATVVQGRGFTLDVTLTNDGDAAADVVVPSITQMTGATQTSTASAPPPTTLDGHTSQTFSWPFLHDPVDHAPLSFTAHAVAVDANSRATLTIADASSPMAQVVLPTACGANEPCYGFGGLELQSTRLNAPATQDRVRVKPYSMLPTEFQRVLGMTPQTILGQDATYNSPPARWAVEPAFSAVNLYQTFQAAFEGCLTYTAQASAFASNPSAATAPAQCQAFAQKFWDRAPTAAETQACVSFATGSANADPNPRRRWAYACATVLSTADFLTE